MSLGIPSGPGVFPLERFLRHVSYRALVSSEASRKQGEVLFSRMKPSLVCHGYCRIAHIHSMGWSVGSELSGACLWKDFCCVEKMMFAIASGCVARLPSLSIRQSSGVASWRLKIRLWIFLGFLSSIDRYFLIAFLQTDSMDLILATI